jgi:hypothetical protein
MTPADRVSLISIAEMMGFTIQNKDRGKITVWANSDGHWKIIKSAMTGGPVFDFRWNPLENDTDMLNMLEAVARRDDVFSLEISACVDGWEVRITPSGDHGEPESAISAYDPCRRRAAFDAVSAWMKASPG